MQVIWFLIPLLALGSARSLVSYNKARLLGLLGGGEQEGAGGAVDGLLGGLPVNPLGESGTDGLMSIPNEIIGTVTGLGGEVGSVVPEGVLKRSKARFILDNLGDLQTGLLGSVTGTELGPGPIEIIDGLIDEITDILTGGSGGEGVTEGVENPVTELPEAVTDMATEPEVGSGDGIGEATEVVPEGSGDEGMMVNEEVLESRLLGVGPGAIGGAAVGAALGGVVDGVLGKLPVDPLGGSGAGGLTEGVGSLPKEVIDTVTGLGGQSGSVPVGAVNDVVGGLTGDVLKRRARLLLDNNALNGLTGSDIVGLEILQGLLENIKEVLVGNPGTGGVTDGGIVPEVVPEETVVPDIGGVTDMIPVDPEIPVDNEGTGEGEEEPIVDASEVAPVA